MGQHPDKSVSVFNPPQSVGKEVREELHGQVILDKYQWLETKDDAEVSEWTSRQHNFTVDFVNNSCPELPDVRREIELYIDRDSDSAPFFKFDREFFHRRSKGSKQDKLYTRIGGKDVLLFDPES